MWAVSHFRHLLYGNTVKIYTDHTSVKAVLESPNPSAKHARWWTRVFGCGVKDIQICYRAGRENQRADALSRSPCSLSPVKGIAEGEVQVASVTSQNPHQLSVQTTVKNELTNEVTSLETCDTAIAPTLDEHKEKTLGCLEVTHTPRLRPMVSETGFSNTVESGSVEEQATNNCESTVDGPISGEPTPTQRPVDRAVTLCLGTAPDKITGTDLFGLETPHSTTNARLDPQTETVLAELVSPGPKLHKATVNQPSVQAITSQLEEELPATSLPYDLGREQLKDPEVKLWIDYLTDGSLPREENQARKIVLQASQLFLLDGVLYYLNPKTRHRRAVVPTHLRPEILRKTHAGKYSGHFSGRRLYSTLMSVWWWPGMYTDAEKCARACPECMIATGTGRRNRPPLHPIPVQRPFQVLGIDIMDLPITEKGNKHVVVIQDLFTKWPMVFPVPDQRALRIAKLIAEEVVPVFGVPECLLSDRGTNLLSHLVLDLCRMLGTTKLNTTAHHPQCDGAVERFNRTLKTMLRKHAARFGSQWDSYLPGVLWAYRNTPHTSTGEKPSFLLFGIDCRSPTEAAYMPVSDIRPLNLEDYREQLMAMLSSAREIAANSIQRAQKTYKHQYDRHARPSNLRVGDWVLVRFPQDECGRFRKLSRPWHGPYRVLERKDPDVVVAKVYHPQHGQICVHQSRVCGCPDDFPAGYYWYGGKQKGPGRPPKWVERLLDSRLPTPRCDRQPEGEQCPSGQLSQSDYANSAVQNLFEQSVTPLLDTGLSYRPEDGDMQEDYNLMIPNGSHEEATQEQGNGREITYMTQGARTLNQPDDMEDADSEMNSAAETAQDSEMNSAAETAQDSEMNSAAEFASDSEIDSSETMRNCDADSVQGAKGPTRASRLRKNVKPPDRLM